MLANNEIGVIQPLEQIATLCRSRNILLHTDAAQAVGKIPLNIEKMGVDLVSFSGHKLYGPRGVGVLVARRQRGKAPITAQIFGGGHQGGLRSGTLNVPGDRGTGPGDAACHRGVASRDRAARGPPQSTV